MSLLENIKQAQQQARKDKNSESLAILQVALSSLKNESIKKQTDLKDEEVVAVLQTQVKQLRDALQDFVKAGRDDLISQTNKEIELLTTFLPAQLSEAEIEKVTQQVITELKPTGPQDFGKVMGATMAKLKGQADGKLVQQTVQKLLA